MSSLALIPYVNIKVNHSAGEVVKLKLEKKYIQTGKGGGFKFKYSYVDKTKPPLHISVEREKFYNSQISDIHTYKEFPGYLGFKWGKLISP